MEDNIKEVNEIEDKEPVIVKPKKVKTVVKYKFIKEDVGTDADGNIRYKKGQSYELTKKQIDNYLKNKLICQH